MSAGQVITGGVVSTNWMCCRQVAVLPQASVAFHVRSMPAWPVQLAGVAASVKVMAGLPPHQAILAGFLVGLIGAGWGVAVGINRAGFRAHTTGGTIENAASKSK